MNQADALDIVQSALWTVIVASGPAIAAAMAIGIIIGLLQALTQVQEMTLTFIPKIVAILVTSGLFGIVFELVRRRQLMERYALLWMLAALVLLLLAVIFNNYVRQRATTNRCRERQRAKKPPVVVEPKAPSVDPVVAELNRIFREWRGSYGNRDMVASVGVAI